MIYLILNYYYIELWAKPYTPETPPPPRVPLTPNIVAKTSGRDLRIHYKNTYETAKAIKGLTIAKAKQYLKDVLAHRRCVPYTKHYGGIGRTGQAAEFGKTLGRWP
jgi:large subunit ribosomal protein L17e